MFKHFLLPTDGSPLSDAAVDKAVTFAKEAQAKITGLHVMPEWPITSTARATAKDHAETYLARVAEAAQAAGVACETLAVGSDHPYQEIIKTAETSKCDLIVMASHGRSAVQGLLLGSQTNKVLAHTKIPVLVYR